MGGIRRPREDNASGAVALLIYADVDWSTCAPATGAVDSSAIPNLKVCDSHVAVYVIVLGAWLSLRFGSPHSLPLIVDPHR